jgi:hypothetical protein
MALFKFTCLNTVQRSLSFKKNKITCSFVLIQKNQKIKATEHFGVFVFQPAHAIQLTPHGGIQTVLLTAGPRNRLQNNNFNPKCSEAI